MRGRLVAGIAILGIASVFALTGRWPWRRVEERPLGVTLDAPAPEPPRFVETHDTLHRGETVGTLLARYGLGERERVTLGGYLDFRRLPAGLVFRVRRPVDESVPSEIIVRDSPERRVLLRRAGSEWTASVEPIAWHAEVVRAEGVIESSLYEALDAGIADDLLAGAERQRLAWDLADVFAWQLDFTRDIQGGERYRVALERLVSE